MTVKLKYWTIEECDIGDDLVISQKKDKKVTTMKIGRFYDRYILGSTASGTPRTLSYSVLFASNCEVTAINLKTKKKVRVRQAFPASCQMGRPGKRRSGKTLGGRSLSGKADRKRAPEGSGARFWCGRSEEWGPVCRSFSLTPPVRSGERTGAAV